MAYFINESLNLIIFLKFFLKKKNLNFLII